MFAYKLRRHETVKKTLVLWSRLKILSDGADTTDDSKLKKPKHNHAKSYVLSDVQYLIVNIIVVTLSVTRLN